MSPTRQAHYRMQPSRRQSDNWSPKRKLLPYSVLETTNAHWKRFVIFCFRNELTLSPSSAKDEIQVLFPIQLPTFLASTQECQQSTNTLLEVQSARWYSSMAIEPVIDTKGSCLRSTR